MKQARSLVCLTLWLAAAGFSLGASTAHADEYADVSALVRAGKLQDALAKADQFLATQPRDPQMRFIKGVVQRDTGKTAEAIATFTKLTEDYPELPEPYNNLAVLYAGQSQFDKARAALEMAIRTNPSYATAHENLGDIYAKLASQAYNKALQLDNNSQAAVAPKLALIREIFANPAKATRAPAPAATPPATTTNPSSNVATPAAPVAAKPAATPAPAVLATAPTTQAPAPAVTKPATPASAPPAQAAPAQPAAAPAATPSHEKGEAAVADVEAAVMQWAKAWSARDVKAYLAAYGKSFDPPGSMSRKAWEDEREQRILGKSSISVKIEKLKVTVDGKQATARFRQDYKAGGLAVASSKVLELSKVGDRWLIVKETVGN